MFKTNSDRNRGEIAAGHQDCPPYGDRDRRRLFEADRDTLHVEMADDAVLIGPPAAAESYLVMEKSSRLAARAAPMR